MSIKPPTEDHCCRSEQVVYWCGACWPVKLCQEHDLTLNIVHRKVVRWIQYLQRAEGVWSSETEVPALRPVCLTHVIVQLYSAFFRSENVFKSADQTLHGNISLSGAQKYLAGTQVVPLKKMRQVCNLHHSYTSTVRQNVEKKSRKSLCMIFKLFIFIFLCKISIWLSQTSYFFKKLFFSPHVTCVSGTCLNSLSV